MRYFVLSQFFFQKLVLTVFEQMLFVRSEVLTAIVFLFPDFEVLEGLLPVFFSVIFGVDVSESVIFTVL